MTWREEAKQLGIPLFQRRKEDVLRDIEAKKTKQEVTKITISPREATEICSNALFKYIADQGLRDITCEHWFVNCKRKGIVFKGIKNVDHQFAEAKVG